MSAQFEKIKNYVLGKNYDLSVAFLSPAQMRKVTLKTKKKNKASNVLSFPLSKTSGEILICKETAKKEAASYGMTQTAFVAYLFIHGLYHLKGYKHSDTMDRVEHRTFKKFGFERNE